MDNGVNGIPEIILTPDEEERHKRFEDDPEAMLRLIDLLFLGYIGHKDLPS